MFKSRGAFPSGVRSWLMNPFVLSRSPSKFVSNAYVD